MIDVKAAIEKTLQAQRKSEISIEATSQEMMTYLNRGEKTIEKVIGPIEAGLAAISNSNNSLRSVEKKLETSLANAAEAVAHLSELTSSLKSMPVFAKQHEALVKSIESLEVLLEKQNVLLVALRTTRPERKLVPGVKRRDAAKAKARRQV
jgi:DNA repair ATPase RecN